VYNMEARKGDLLKLCSYTSARLNSASGAALLSAVFHAAAGLVTARRPAASPAPCKPYGNQREAAEPRRFKKGIY